MRDRSLARCDRAVRQDYVVGAPVNRSWLRRLVVSSNGYWKPPLSESWPAYGWAWLFASVVSMAVWVLLASTMELPRFVVTGLFSAAAALIAYVLGHWYWRRRYWTTRWTEPFCIYCGYSQRGLPWRGHICPECGSAFSKAAWQRYVADPERYARKHPTPAGGQAGDSK